MSVNLSWNGARTKLGGSAGIGALVCALAFTVVNVEVQAQEQIDAVWKAHEVDFFYRSSTTLFPCNELANRVATILRAVGARDDIKVRATDCPSIMPSDDTLSDRWSTPSTSADRFRSQTFPSDRFGSRLNERPLEQMSRVHIQLMMPVQVTPEVLAQIDKDKSRRELVSRVTGNPAAALNDPVIFRAQRQPITLSQRSIRLEPSDCELIEQLSASVFRELDVTVVRRSSTCTSRERSRIAPQLTVEAITPVISTQQIPGAAQLETKPSATPVPDTKPPEPATQAPPQ
jgi:hypothetical protein